jgi:hypothetical protein
MGKERSTRITIETDRVLIVAKLKGVRLTCERCGQEVDWESVELPEPLPESARPFGTEALPRNLLLGTGEGGQVTAWKTAVGRFFRGITGWMTT